MVGFLCTLGALVTLTTSYRIYDAYIRAVGREEARGRRGVVVMPAPRPRHLGHKLFLLEHFCLAVVALIALRDWLPVFAFERVESLGSIVEMLLFSSGILAVWLVFEGRFLQRFYLRILRAMRRSESGVRAALDRGYWGRQAHPITRRLVGTILAWAATPFLLALLGVHVVTRSTPADEALVVLAVWWALPLSFLAGIVGRDVLRLRSRILAGC